MNKRTLTTEEFQAKIRKVNSNLVVLEPYKGLFYPIKIQDELGIIYNTQPTSILKGRQPSIQSAIDKTDAFIKKANYLYNNKFDYSKAEYKNSDIKLIVICPKHGELHVTPIYHLKGRGCAACNLKGRSSKNAYYSSKSFKIKLKSILPNITIIGKYINLTTPLLVQDKLKIKYLIRPSFLLKNNIPSIRHSIDKTDYFIKKFNYLHKNKYSYLKTNYIDMETPVIITCPNHGDFEQTPHCHFSTKGCSKCNLTPTYTKTGWNKFCNAKLNADPKVYIIRCYNDEEEFIKIGMTSNEVSIRFKGKLMPYNYEVLKEIKGSPDFVYDKEKELHRQFNAYKYIPKIHFNGYNECFLLSTYSSIIYYL